MFPHSLIRMLSIFIVFGILKLSPSRTEYFWILFSFAMPHFILALVYSQKYIKTAFQHTQNYPAAIAFLSLGALSIYYRYPALSFYFPLHHVLSETYSAHNSIRGNLKKPLNLNLFVSSRFFLNLFAYCILLMRNNPYDYLNTFPLIIYVVGFFISCYIFFSILFRMRLNLKKTMQMDHVVFELTMIFFVVASLFFRFNIHLNDIIFYHIVTWVFLPIKGMKKSGFGSVRKFLFWYVVLILLTLSFTPLAKTAWGLSPQMLGAQFILLTYIHIITSFALSRANPRWLIRMFKFIPET